MSAGHRSNQTLSAGWDKGSGFRLDWMLLAGWLSKKNTFGGKKKKKQLKLYVSVNIWKERHTVKGCVIKARVTEHLSRNICQRREPLRSEMAQIHTRQQTVCESQRGSPPPQEGQSQLPDLVVTGKMPIMFFSGTWSNKSNWTVCSLSLSLYLFILKVHFRWVQMWSATEE